MTQSQTDCKPSLAAGVNSEDTAGARDGQDWTPVGAMVMVRGESSVWLAAPSRYSPQAAQFVVAEQGPVSAGKAVPLMGGQVRRGPSSSAGLAESKVR